MQKLASKVPLIETEIQLSFNGPYASVYKYLIETAGGSIISLTEENGLTCLKTNVPIPHQIYWELRYHTTPATDHEKKEMALESLIARRYLEPTSAILDFGCGVGRHTPWLAELGDYYGVDTSEQAIVRALPGYRYFAVKDHLPFRDGTFQTVFSCQVLKHILSDEELAYWITEMIRVTGPHGRHVHFDTTWADTNLTGHTKLRLKAEYLKLFHDAGVALETDDWAFPHTVRTVLYGMKE